MNNFTKLAIAALLCSTAVANAADNSMYVLVEGGYALSAKKDKIISTIEANEGNTITKKAKRTGSGFFAAGVGYRFDSNLRTDFTLNYMPVQTTKTTGYETVEGVVTPLAIKAKQSALAGMINAYYDITAFGDTFTPYVGVGVGLAKNTYKVSNSVAGIDGKAKGTTQFAYQAGLGTLVKVTDSVDVKVGYRYMNTGRVKIKNTSLKTTFGSHQFLAGVQFKL